MGKLLAFSTIVLGILAAAPAGAESRLYRAEYTISALGLPIGASKFETAITPDSYELSGTLRAKGLAALFKPTSGSLSVNGRVGAERVEAALYTLNYVTGGKKQHTQIGFSGGAVTRTVNAPEVRRRKDWIDVKPGDFANALDPFSAMLVPAASASAVCDRTVRVYDGAMRADMKLSYLRTTPFSTAGYKGNAVTCRAQFLPVSGYSRKKKEIAWMRDKGEIDIAFAPIEGTGLYAPVKARIATQIGPVTIYATRFESVKR